MNTPPPEEPPGAPQPLDVFAAAFAGRDAAMLRHAARSALGERFGLRHFGVNVTLLPPGAVSALCHWHSRQDEFVVVLQGRPTLHTQTGDAELAPGQCVGFAGGVANGHQLVNRSGETVVLLEVGDRTPGDVATYPENTPDEIAAALGR